MKRSNRRKGSKNGEAGDDGALHLDEPADQPVQVDVDECANLVLTSGHQPRAQRKKELKIREKQLAIQN